MIISFVLQYLFFWQVCASTAKGKGDKVSVIGTTTELGMH